MSSTGRPTRNDIGSTAMNDTTNRNDQRADDRNVHRAAAADTDRLEWIAADGLTLRVERNGTTRTPRFGAGRPDGIAPVELADLVRDRSAAAAAERRAAIDACFAAIGTAMVALVRRLQPARASGGSASGARMSLGLTAAASASAHSR
jgi:hypothetical protein